VRLLFRRVVMPPMPGLTRAEQLELRERTLAEKAEEVRAIRARALAGEPFPGLVRELSEDPATRANGGRPEGGFLKALGWPASALDELAALPAGGFSEPIFVQGGMWLVQLEELVVTPLASVEAEIRARLAAKAPEPDELASVAGRLRENGAYETLPALHDRAQPGSKLPLETPVMRIDGQDVSRGRYAAFLLASRGDVSAVRFAEEAHIERLAAEAGIAPSPAEIEAVVETRVQDLVNMLHKGNRADWEAATARARGSVDAWFRDARQNARMEFLLGGLCKRSRVVTDDVVRQSWRARYGEGGRSLHMRVIRIDTVLPVFEEGVSPEEARRLSAAAIEDARSRAAEVAQRAREGEDFADLARRYSMDAATRAGGGEMPLGFDHHTLPPEAVAAIDALKPGQLAGPVEAGLSHFVIELLAIRDVPFDTVAAELRKELENAVPTNVETRGFYNVTTRELKIEVLPALFR
jgi:parvulin-like peptidyl-prolyl isomerase